MEPNSSPVSGAPAADVSANPSLRQQLAPSSGPRHVTLTLFLAVIAGLIAAWWWSGRQSQAEMNGAIALELAKRDASIEQRLSQAELDRQDLAIVRDKVSALEAELVDAQSKTAVLEGKYQDLMQSRDERLLGDIEQSLTTASQQLQLAGNVEGALLILRAIDLRLSTNPSPRLMPLRRLIARDIEKLKSSALADMSATIRKLEAILAGVDAFPLAYEQRPRGPAIAVKKGKAIAPVPVPPEESGVTADIRQLASEIWQDLRELVKIERVDLADQSFLMPPQIYFLRENLKLRLLAARVALLQRDGRVYQEELLQAQNSLKRFFDVRADNVRAANETLQGLIEKGGKLDLPGLDDTLNAVRSSKLPRSGS